MKLIDALTHTHSIIYPCYTYFKPFASCLCLNSDMPLGEASASPPDGGDWALGALSLLLLLLLLLLVLMPLLPLSTTGGGLSCVGCIPPV